MCKVFLGIPSGEDGTCGRRSHPEVWSSGFLVIPWWSLDLTSHYESFSPSGLLRMVLILGYCQSVVPSTSLLKENLGGTRRIWTAWLVLEKLCREQKSWFFTLALPIPHAQPVGWPGTEKNGFLQTHCMTKAGFWIQSVQSILLGKGSIKESGASYVKNGKHTWMIFLFENYGLSLKV